MTNSYADLIPKTMPPTIANPGPLATDAFWMGWPGFIVVTAVVLVVLALLFILAIKVIYWVTFAIARGAHEGWIFDAHKDQTLMLLNKIQNAVDPATLQTLLGLMLLFAIMDYGPAVIAEIDKRIGVKVRENTYDVIGCSLVLIVLANWWLS